MQTFHPLLITQSFAFLLTVLLPLEGNSWDPAGHLLVGEIAWQKSAPATREKVSQLVAALESKYNGGQPYHYVTAGCWMDDMRAEPKYPWGPLHYVTVPYTPTGSAFREPPPPHILSAIDEEIALLSKQDTDEAKRSEALGMLIHFIGDLHQPMHVTDWDDRGGNSYLVMGVPFSDLMKKQRSNLHTFWDKAFRFDAREGQIVEVFTGDWITNRPSAPGEGPIHEEAEGIMAEFPPESLPQLAEKDHRGWARESHTLGCLFAYPARPRPTDTEVVKLEPDYVLKARTIARERIALAGYRLARMLDALFAAPAQ